MKTLKEILEVLENEMKKAEKGNEDAEEKIKRINDKDINFLKDKILEFVKNFYKRDKRKTIKDLINELSKDKEFKIENVSKRKDIQKIAISAINNALENIERDYKATINAKKEIIEIWKNEINKFKPLIKEYGENAYFCKGSIFIGNIENPNLLKILASLNENFQKEGLKGNFKSSEKIYNEFKEILESLKGANIKFYRKVIKDDEKITRVLIKI